MWSPKSGLIQAQHCVCRPTTASSQLATPNSHFWRQQCFKHLSVCAFTCNTCPRSFLASKCLYRGSAILSHVVHAAAANLQQARFHADRRGICRAAIPVGLSRLKAREPLPYRLHRHQVGSACSIVPPGL